MARGARRPDGAPPPRAAARRRADVDLGPEPPDVVNFLTHGFTVTPEAVPATLLDLAARGVVELERRGPGVFVCRLGPEPDDLPQYERRVVALLLVDGELLRLRARRQEQALYAAVDDGRSERIRAFVVEPQLYAQLEQGSNVAATVTRA